MPEGTTWSRHIVYPCTVQHTLCSAPNELQVRYCRNSRVLESIYYTAFWNIFCVCDTQLQTTMHTAATRSHGDRETDAQQQHSTGGVAHHSPLLAQVILGCVIAFGALPGCLCVRFVVWTVVVPGCYLLLLCGLCVRRGSWVGGWLNGHSAMLWRWLVTPQVGSKIETTPSGSSQHGLS